MNISFAYSTITNHLHRTLQLFVIKFGCDAGQAEQQSPISLALPSQLTEDTSLIDHCLP